MRSLIRPLVAAALLMASAPLYSASANPDDLAGCDAKDQIEVRKDHWIRINAPKVDTGAREGERKIVDFSTPPSAPGRIYTTNGTVVKVTDDGGCEWVTMFGGLTEKLNVSATKQDILTHVASPSDPLMWVASYDDVSGVERPHVYVAGNLNETLANPTFQEVQTGMPPVGRPVALEGSPTIHDVMYVVVEGPPDPTSDDPTGPARRLYVTYVPNDPPELALLNMSWREVKLPPGFGKVEGITPAPGGRGLWAWLGDKYAYLEDSYADEPAWTVKSAEGRIVTIDVTRGSLVTLVLDTDQGGVGWRPDGKTIGLPTKPVGYAHGGLRDVAVVTGARGTFGYDTFVRRWVDITPKGVGAFREVVMPATNLGRHVLALSESGDAFYRFNTYPGERFLPPVSGPVGTGDYVWPDNRGGLVKPELTPLSQEITVTPGERRDVPVTFRVPADPTPLDVYFLVDTTASMRPAIEGLKSSIESIAKELRGVLGKDACFGVGEVKDYEGIAQRYPPYERRLPITCESDISVPRVRAALATLEQGGGGNLPEAQTLGLTQAVTGKGTSSLPRIPAGQDADFRPGAFKVIVLITDANFNQGGQYPTIDQAVETLDVVNAKVVGVQVNGDTDPALVRRDLNDIASGTRTYAPERGVDCDGDGIRTEWDLPPGAPLVCEASGTEPNIGPAIIGLLLGVTDPGTLAVDVEDEHDVVEEPIKGRTRDVFNLKTQSAIGFALPIRCSKEQDGLDLPIGLVPSVRAVPIGIRGEVVVKCRSNPIAPPPRIPPEVQEPVFDPPRVQRPPVAIALPQPPPAPAQPISNINLNAGISQEEEQQFQLAAVTQGASEEQQDETVELAMSDYRARDAQAAGAMLGGAMLLSAGAAVAYRRRLRSQHAQRTAYARFR